MTAAEPTTPATMTVTDAFRSIGRNPILLWGAFVVVHLWLGLINLYSSSLPLGDVTFVYKYWTDQAIVAHYFVGIDGPWVYPIVALLPMLAARAFGPELYSATWLSMVMLLDAAALVFIVGRGRDALRTLVGWWWVGFLLLLGPIAVGRIDSVSVPLAIVGVLFVARRPRVAIVLLTIATWIKVWPAAIIAAMIISLRGRLRIIAAAAATCVVIAGVTVALGSGANVFSFISQQANRGLQIESPIANVWLWAEFAGQKSTSIYYDRDILTWQIHGPGVGVASTVMTPIMVIALLAVTAFGIWVIRQRARAEDVLPVLSLAYALAFIAFNKVGSPQYITWLAVPVILGLCISGVGRGVPFRTPTIAVTVLATLTQLIYPYLYFMLLGVQPAMLAIISARNLLYFLLLAWCIRSLWRTARMARSRRIAGSSGGLTDADQDSWLGAPRPLVWRSSRRAERRFSMGKHPQDDPSELIRHI